MVTTSNFTIAGKLPQAVAISQGVPKGWRGRRYIKLAPPWFLVREHNREVFEEKYRSGVLGKLDARKVLDDLGPDAILLCWERPGVFCHRMMVAAWIQEQTGVVVPEYVRPAPELPEPAQKGLFL